MECLKIFFFQKQNRRVEINPKIQWRMAAERNEAVASGLSFSLVWSTLEIARTFAAAPTGGENPSEKFGAAKPHR